MNRSRSPVLRRATTAVLVGIALLLAASIWRAKFGRPRHAGRSVHSWFSEYCLVTESRPGAWDAERRRLNSQLAMHELGTNALPFLVDQSFGFGAPSALRSNLHELFRELPESVGGGSFLPPWRRSMAAFSLLRVLRPASSALVPLLRSRYASADLRCRQQAVLLAGCCRDVDAELSGWLESAITNRAEDPLTRGLAIQSLGWLGPAASNLLPTIVREVERESSPDPRYLLWLARLGDPATSAIPVMERHLASRNSRLRLNAALAMVQLDSGHTQALALLRAEVPTGDWTNQTVHALLQFGALRPVPGLGDLLELAARREAARWSPAGQSYYAWNCLERADPERARTLARELMRSIGPDPAAGLLLRLERTNTVAAELLIDQARRDPIASFGVIHWLGEADASNTSVIRCLEWLSVDRKGQARAVAEQARTALAHLRYREVCIVRGFPTETGR